ncbi:MAG: hypothetical protein WKG00_19910 [Polyangiaceae bacterium]
MSCEPSSTTVGATGDGRAISGAASGAPSGARSSGGSPGIVLPGPNTSGPAPSLGAVVGGVAG